MILAFAIRSMSALLRALVTVATFGGTVVAPLPAQQLPTSQETATVSARENREAALVRVAARQLPRGTVLTDRDMVVAPDSPSVTVALSGTPVSVGWVTRRLVRVGEALRAPAVAPAPLFSAHHPVRFVVKRAGIQMSIDGVALIAASLGDTIPVRLGAKRRMMGVVSGLDEVVA
ncbi:MAG: flagella basal body P-ring formation protein FlgA, partial [Gemmatimonadaceae bacterium]